MKTQFKIFNYSFTVKISKMNKFTVTELETMLGQVHSDIAFLGDVSQIVEEANAITDSLDIDNWLQNNSSSWGGYSSFEIHGLDSIGNPLEVHYQKDTNGDYSSSVIEGDESEDRCRLLKSPH